MAAWVKLYAGDLWWPATVLLFSPRWLLAIPLIPLALAAVCWRRRSLTVVLLTLLLILGPIMGFQFPWRAALSTTPPGKRLRVLTCNMHWQKPLEPSLERLLAEADPDVVAVQELPAGSFDYFSGEQWHVHRTGGLFLASRYPIRLSVRLGDDSMKGPGKLMRYELETPDGVVVLFSLHFASPREGLNETTEFPETGFVELVENSDVRWEQSEGLVRLVDEVTEPVLVMGDFNTPSESAIFRRVWGRYTDAFMAAGWGWGYTFFAKKTTVRIDHILVGPGWYCERCWVGPFVGSPHHPLLADLILQQPQP
jgi:endonuclease/exonuclease/phosphatase (EEP) superfamily protein YafD